MTERNHSMATILPFATGRAPAAEASGARPRAAPPEALRAAVRRLDRGAGTVPAGIVTLGDPALDGHLPDGGLARGALHEIVPAGEEAAGAALGFTLSLVARCLGSAAPAAPVLWVTPEPALYGPGLAAWGVDPERLILVMARRPRDRLWAIEEGLSVPGLAAVAGEVRTVGDTAGRRLQLAAQASGVPAFLLAGGPAGSGAVTATTRWRLAPVAPAAPDGPGELWRLGPPAWQADLERCRGGRPGTWRVEWDDETHRLHLAALPGDRPAAARDDRRAG